MKRVFLLALSIALLSIAILAQTPSPSISPIANPANNRTSPTPSPSPTAESKPEVTVIKWGGENGLQITTSSSRVLAILGAIVLLGFIGYLVLRWRLRQHAWSPWLLYGSIVIGIGTILLVLVILFLLGIMWGRSSARSEVQQYIDANRLTIAQEQISRPIATPAPTPAATPAITANPTHDNESSSTAPTPIYAHPAGFVLLIGPELIVLTFIILWWFRGFGFRFHFREHFEEVYHRLNNIESELSNRSHRVPYDLNDTLTKLQSEIRDLRVRVPHDLKDILANLKGPPASPPE